jgi:hypothetical protein
MGFVENLRKKIEIDRTVSLILGAWGPAGSGRRIDKETVRGLLEMGPFRHEQIRDLDLYYLREGEGEDNQWILVLDNELPIFQTTADDVAMRRSPLIKEMVSIRNAIKILSDKDITVSKREDSLKRVQKMLVGSLDLSFTPSDVEQIADDGAASLEKNYDEGVNDSLELFAELLDYQPAPKAFKIPHYDIYGAVEQGPAGEQRFGPMVIFSRIRNELRLLEQGVSSRNANGIEWIGQVARGKEPADREGNEVFDWLKSQVPRAHPEGKIGVNRT